MCIRLVKDYSGDADFAKNFVACYAIGWRITQEELDAYPDLAFATGESDTGVIVSFNSEAVYIDDSLTVPKGTKTLAINPLNWKTDETPADKSLNLGACFTDYDGNIVREIPALTGAYIDNERGALKVTDVTAEQYPPVLDIFRQGVYHLYDYQFFYRNLEKMSGPVLMPWKKNSPTKQVCRQPSPTAAALSQRSMCLQAPPLPQGQPLSTAKRRRSKREMNLFSCKRAHKPTNKRLSS